MPFGLDGGLPDSGSDVESLQEDDDDQFRRFLELQSGRFLDLFPRSFMVRITPHEFPPNKLFCKQPGIGLTLQSLIKNGKGYPPPPASTV